MCGDQIDLIDGQPTGAVRISFGYMSSKKDADQFLQMIYSYFVTKTIMKKPKQLTQLEKQTNCLNGKLKRIFLYPIKSCGAFEVKRSWDLTPFGLEYDRQWMIVDSNGICVTQKQNSRLCLIRPFIDKVKGCMDLMFEGMF